MPSLKIAQVTTVESSVKILILDQIRCLQQMGHHVTAVCDHSHTTIATPETGSLNFRRVGMSRDLRPFRDLKSLFDLVRCFRQENFDVVHTHTPKAGMLGPLAARIAGVPMVLHTIHGLLFHDAMSPVKQAVFWMPERLTATFAHQLLSQSEEDVEVAIRTGLCSRRRIHHLGNGIDLTLFLPNKRSERALLRRQLGFSESDFVVGFVGRLVYEKGFSELSAVARALSLKHQTLKFLIVGPQESGKKDAVRADDVRCLEQQTCVRFLGWKSPEHMPGVYAAMDAFVLPSHREGIPRVAMEASAMALPVVTSDIRGCREVVVHEKTGLLVPPKSAKALADAVERLFFQKSEAERMGQNGRLHIQQKFNQTMVLERLRKFYSRVANQLEGVGKGSVGHRLQDLDSGSNGPIHSPTTEKTQARRIQTIHGARN